MWREWPDLAPRPTFSLLGNKVGSQEHTIERYGGSRKEQCIENKHCVDWGLSKIHLFLSFET